MLNRPSFDTKGLNEKEEEEGDDEGTYTFCFESRNPDLKWCFFSSLFFILPPFSFLLPPRRENPKIQRSSFSSRKKKSSLKRENLIHKKKYILLCGFVSWSYFYVSLQILVVSHFISFSLFNFDTFLIHVIYVYRSVNVSDVDTRSSPAYQCS